MKTNIRKPVLIAILVVSMTLPALAGVKFERLDEDQFIVTHRKTSRLGGQGKALRTLYEEIASICVAAGFEYFEVRSQAVKGRSIGWGGGAGATAEVKFYPAETKEDLLRCEPLADQGKVRAAKRRIGG